MRSRLRRRLRFIFQVKSAKVCHRVDTDIYLSTAIHYQLVLGTLDHCLQNFLHAFNTLFTDNSLNFSGSTDLQMTSQCLYRSWARKVYLGVSARLPQLMKPISQRRQVHLPSTVRCDTTLVYMQVRQCCLDDVIVDLHREHSQPSQHKCEIPTVRSTFPNSMGTMYLVCIGS
jgi:hypothetical protein